jgi:glutamate dehydrogenase
MERQGLGTVGQEFVDTDLPEDFEAAGTTDSAEDGVKTTEDLENYIDDITETVRIGVDQSIAILTPWFFNNMPRVYYQTTPRPEKVRHLSAIITGHVFETKQTVELWDRNKTKVTFIGPGSDRNILVEMAHRLLQHPIKMGSLYFSRDKLLFLSTFFCSAHRPLDMKNIRITEKIDRARMLLGQEFPDPSEMEAIEHFLQTLDNDFVTYATAARIQITYRMLRHMLHHEGAHTILEPIENSRSARLILGVKNAVAPELLENVLHMMNRYEFNVVRSFVINFAEGYRDQVSILHFIINHQGGEKVDPNMLAVRKLNKAMRTIGWVDTDEYASFIKEPLNFSINAANFVRSLSAWVHILLGKQNPYYYSEYKIRLTFFKHLTITRLMVDLYRGRFDPTLNPSAGQSNLETIKNQLEKELANLLDEVEVNIFRECLNFIENILTTNYAMPTKTGLAFRLDPKVLNAKYYPQTPFGIFFIVGKDYRMFHVRWKDISRGGLRVVIPRTESEYDFALAGLFDEVYGLSYAQQMKNKDIPEGGSKAVLLLKPNGHRDQAVRGAVNALLDLLVSSDEAHEDTPAGKRLSFYNQEEIIYLGPDENITPDLIRWIPEQAARRGYKYSRAFMSSKPEDGINHKEFGVTSEGIHVFIKNTLEYLGINPDKQNFTVKITGGPDGDVAGNLLKILHREHGERARILSIADGLGCAYDPGGLDWAELLRLVQDEKSIAFFDKEKLSDKSKAYVLTADTPENTRIRNEIYFMHFTDIFIPGGGRPYSVNDKNWQKFLDADGKPTTSGIIEGANIFFTPLARVKLQQAGVIMIKDSSANKTGVICSSYEIIASLILSKEEFLALKKDYVKEVIHILRTKADQEAKLLFAEYSQNGEKISLVDLSLEISKEINQISDMLLQEFTANAAQVLSDPKFIELIKEHCPPILVKRYGERLLKNLPAAHKIAIIAKSVASHIVYREGLGFIKQIVEEDRFNAIITYIHQDQLTRDLVEAVQKSNMAHKDQIASILKISATRDLTRMALEKRNLDLGFRRRVRGTKK